MSRPANPAKPVFFLSAVLILQMFFFAASPGKQAGNGFSADMIANVTGGREILGKVYISGENSRIESDGIVTITRTREKLAWILLPSFKVYLEHPITPEMSPSIEKFPGETARVFLGEENVDGRQAKKYKITFHVKNRQQVVYCWVDDQFGAPIKTVSEKGDWSVEYKNIKPGEQPNALFELPRGYRKLIFNRRPSKEPPEISSPGGKKSMTMTVQPVRTS